MAQVHRSLAIDGVAVVTGAGRGVGAGCAMSLAQRGARVIVADIDFAAATAEASELARQGLSAEPFEVDVAVEGSIEALADRAAEIGNLTAWVNNAGVSQRVPLVDLTVADWDRMMILNVRSVFLGTRAAARRMPEGASIVNVASISSFIALPNLTHYGASKGAVASFTKHAAIDLAPRRIRVNAVAPGTVQTAMTAERLSIPGQRAWSEARIPLGRVAEPSDIAGAVAFLCSPEAAYITGAILACDGGWTASA